MGIYIEGFKMPEGGYRTIEIAYDADGHPMALADNGDVFDVILADDVRSTECCEECRAVLLETIDHYKQLCADVRPVVHGYWIAQPYDGDGEWHCSECGVRCLYKMNFCPHCGADMRPELPEGE